MAHENGAIRLASSKVTTGSELSMRGERFPKNTTLRLELRGALETFRLGEVRTDAKGVFEARLGLPPAARAGSYTLVAVAPDGDKVAQADLAISAAAPAGMEHNKGGGGASNTASGATSAPHPTAEMMKLPVSTSGLELATIIGVVVLSLGIGLRLVLRAPAAESLGGS